MYLINVYGSPNPNERRCQPFCNYSPCDLKAMTPQEFQEWRVKHLGDSPETLIKFN